MQTNLIGLDWSTSAGEDRHLRELYACFPAASLQPQSSILKTLPPQTALVPLQRGIADVKKHSVIVSRKDLVQRAGVDGRMRQMLLHVVRLDGPFRKGRWCQTQRTCRVYIWTFTNVASAATQLRILQLNFPFAGNHSPVILSMLNVRWITIPWRTVKCFPSD